jgi:hypothetical protein
MSLTNFLENALLNHIRNGSAYTMPTSLHVKLHTGNPGEDAASNAATNATRQTVAFGAASAGSMSATGSPVAEWTNVSTTETYSHFSIWDNASAGNPLGYGALSSPAAVTAGDTFRLTSLTWSLD